MPVPEPAIMQLHVQHRVIHALHSCQAQVVGSHRARHQPITKRQLVWNALAQVKPSTQDLHVVAKITMLQEE